MDRGDRPPTHSTCLETSGPMPQAGEEQLTFREDANPKLSFSHAIISTPGKSDMGLVVLGGHVATWRCSVFR